MKTNCDIIRDLLPLYAEHITSEASNALVEEHLAECEACRAELEQMGLGVPQMTRVFNRLRAMGVDIDPSVYTIEQAKAAILAKLGKGAV